MSALDSVAPNTFCQARFLQPRRWPTRRLLRRPSPPTLRSPVGLRDALQDKEIHPVSDWGQVVAGSNPVSPTQVKGFSVRNSTWP
jgi:hypothetical protein